MATWSSASFDWFVIGCEYFGYSSFSVVIVISGNIMALVIVLNSVLYSYSRQASVSRSWSCSMLSLFLGHLHPGQMRRAAENAAAKNAATPKTNMVSDIGPAVPYISETFDS